MAAVVWGPPAMGEFESTEYQGRFSTTWSAFDRGEIQTRTLADGSVTIPTELRTGASDGNPKSRAHTGSYWVLVALQGDGRVAIPLRYEAVSTEELRNKGSLTAMVGLAHQSGKSE
jgi:hypothetical protein